MRENMKKELCIDTVKQLKHRYGNLQEVIMHSDRGGQYTSEAFRNELKRHGIRQSLSGTGHCYDNARMESFFATLKKEKLYRIPTYKMTRAEVKTVIFRYIFVYYNRIRIYTGNPGSLAVRPSGTEPKIKFYIGVKGKSEDDAEQLIKKIEKYVRTVI